MDAADHANESTKGVREVEVNKEMLHILENIFFAQTLVYLYTMQTMSPRNSKSKTVMQLKIIYHALKFHDR